MVAPIEGIKLSRLGVIKEHPDLENDEDWRKIAIERLKDYMKRLDSEEKKLDYIKEELTKFGYKALFYQVKGWRVKRFK